MTEREVQLLGFEMQTDNGGGYWDTYYYYTYNISDGLSFISCASDEIQENAEWYIDVFNTKDTIRFWKFEQVQSLINTLEKHLIKDE